MARRRRLGGALALVAACGLAAASPAVAGQRAPGMKPALTSDEGGLWGVAERLEQEEAASGERNRDPALEAYISGVACKVAAEYCPEVRVYVMDRPFFNAAMAPNGFTEVWSGLLLRVSNEAELAFALGHEVSHYAENHSIESMRAHRNRSNAVFALSVGIAVLGAASAAGSANPTPTLDATRGLIDAVQLGAIAAFFQFSREHEMEADRLSIARTAQAGFDPRAGVTVWENLMAETAESDFERVRRSGASTNIFDSHPMGKDRIAAIKAELKKTPSGELARERYRAAIRPHLSRWLKDELRRRDYGETLHLIDRLAKDGDDLGVLNFYKAEAYRLRRKDGDTDRAREAYLVAAAHDDAPPQVWRELGEARRKSNDPAGAKAAFESYLAKVPEAEDAWLVQDTLKTLK